ALQRALEAEILERTARCEIGVVLHPLLGRDAELDGLAPRLADIVSTGDRAGAGIPRKAHEAQGFVLFPEPIRCRFGEIAETRFAFGERELGGFGLRILAIIIESEDQTGR